MGKGKPSHIIVSQQCGGHVERARDHMTRVPKTRGRHVHTHAVALSANVKHHMKTYSHLCHIRVLSCQGDTFTPAARKKLSDAREHLARFIGFFMDKWLLHTYCPSHNIAEAPDTWQLVGL